MKLPEKFEFLKSIRFWKLFIVAVAEFLATQAIITPELAHMIAIILGGSVAVRTIDRMGEKIGTPPVEIIGTTSSTLDQIQDLAQPEKRDLHKPVK